MNHQDYFELFGRVQKAGEALPAKKNITRFLLFGGKDILTESFSFFSCKVNILQTQ